MVEQLSHKDLPVIAIYRNKRELKRATGKIIAAGETARANYPDDCVDCFAARVAEILVEQGLIDPPKTP